MVNTWLVFQRAVAAAVGRAITEHAGLSAEPVAHAMLTHGLRERVTRAVCAEVAEVIHFDGWDREGA
jgi:hypothetical protein